MNWHYYDGKNQVGPITESELVELRRAGTVTADTLVWREGLTDWARYHEAGPAVNLDAPVPSPQLPPPLAAAPAAALNASEAVCAECGRVFGKDNMISHGASHVCAGCKPVFMQKLAEGARVGAHGNFPGGLTRMRYAGFWIRFLARMLDGILMSIVLYVPIIIMVVASGRGLEEALGQSGEFGTFNILVLVWQLCFYLLFAGYEIFFTGKYGATPGKMVLQLRVVTPEGCKINYGRATGRFFGYLLSGMICYIGYIIAGFDEQKRALHDHMCNTRVVYKS